MEYFDFIKPGDLDNLPEDPQLAFSEVVRIAQARLVERLETLDSGEHGDWTLILEAKHGFQNVAIGAARKFRIEPFASAEMPIVRNYSDEDYRQFRADLSHYITQIMLNAAEADRSQSIPVREETRQSLRTYVYHLRQAIDNTSLPDWRKVRLHDALTKFEQEITRPRIRFGVAVQVLMTVLNAGATVTDHWDGIVRITNNIVRELAVAKEADNEQRHVSAIPPALLVAPRKVEPPPSFDRNEMDDEIPF